ncbi:hypothetical protein CONLIGDRAFT_689906 [Coniochaeta ligniaria NRRL 30616]|uniref:Uncharacterized protein n=1 Tax=Coniochaeta ligniaria NRRL 30616 TaxID=1408157 RepID=A0A1J7J6Q6_9PEZI|nr:hypothetical protein CONLIGDRAFT_689906 [Coniochaeta ligniaria NRRL 30616]
MVAMTRKRKHDEEEACKIKTTTLLVPPPTPTTRQSPRLAKKQKLDYAQTALPLATPPDSTYGGDSPEATTTLTLDLPPVKKAFNKRVHWTPPTPIRTQASTTLKRGRKWEIFFGREIKDDCAGVTDELLCDFLENEVTARFPQGSTYTGATGQWSRTLDDGSTVVVKEGTTVVFLVEFEGDDLRKVQSFRDLVAEAARAYKSRFNQDAVLVCEIECLMDFI